MAVAINADAANIPAVNFVEQGSDPSAPGSGHAIIYVKSGVVYVRRNAGSPVAVGGVPALTTDLLAVGDGDGNLSALSAGAEGAVPTRQADGSILEVVPTASGGGEASSLLDYVAASDIANATSITADTWTNFGASHSITVGSDGSRLCLITIRLGAFMLQTVNAPNGAVRLDIDSGTYVMVGGLTVPVAHFGSANSIAPLTGGVVIRQLSAGSHTIQAQVMARAANGSLYCRPSTIPNSEFYHAQVVQLP